MLFEERTKIFEMLLLKMLKLKSIIVFNNKIIHQVCLVKACGGFLYAIYYFVTNLNITLGILKLDDKVKGFLNKNEISIDVSYFCLVLFVV